MKKILQTNLKFKVTRPELEKALLEVAQPIANVKGARAVCFTASLGLVGLSTPKNISSSSYRARGLENKL